MSLKSKITILAQILLLGPQTGKAGISHPGWSKTSSIYEVNIRQYSSEGTFKGFERHLKELSDMNVGILWIMPINPIGQVNRKGSLGSYYSIKDYMAVNPEFGTIEDFRHLVSQAHSLGMKVIIDWVANHSSWDNELTKTHPEYYKKNILGRFIPPVKDWNDVIAFNYENRDLWKYMTGAMKFWVKETDIDGFRCDVAGMIRTDFWIYARTELDGIKPVFMLAEDEKPAIHQAFDMTYSWRIYGTMNDIAKGRKTTDSLARELKKDLANFPGDAYRMRFTSNHDENSWNGSTLERMGGMAEESIALCSVIPGMPLCYSGQEAGLQKRLSFFEKDSIQWKTHRFRELFRDLFKLKTLNPALANGENGGTTEILYSKNNCLALLRQKGENRVFAAFNFNKESETIRLTEAPGSYKIFPDGKLQDIKTEIPIEGYGYRIYYN